MEALPEDGDYVDSSGESAGNPVLLRYDGDDDQVNTDVGQDGSNRDDQLASSSRNERSTRTADRVVHSGKVLSKLVYNFNNLFRTVKARGLLHSGRVVTEPSLFSSTPAPHGEIDLYLTTTTLVPLVLDEKITSYKKELVRMITDNPARMAGISLGFVVALTLWLLVITVWFFRSMSKLHKRVKSCECYIRDNSYGRVTYSSKPRHGRIIDSDDAQMPAARILQTMPMLEYSDGRTFRN